MFTSNDVYNRYLLSNSRKIDKSKFISNED